MATEPQGALWLSGKAFQVLRGAIEQRAFPGAEISVVRRGEIVALSGVGHFTYEPESPAVERETVYDLASVTKVVATTPMAMVLYERGQLDIDAPVVVKNGPLHNRQAEAHSPGFGSTEG